MGMDWSGVIPAALTAGAVVVGQVVIRRNHKEETGSDELTQVLEEGRSMRTEFRALWTDCQTQLDAMRAELAAERDRRAKLEAELLAERDRRAQLEAEVA